MTTFVIVVSALGMYSLGALAVVWLSGRYR
jgi:hypothetical protein